MMLGAFVSCKDNDDNNAITPDKNEKADVLIMYYSVGGGNLDTIQVTKDIVCDVFEGSSDNVKMTFQYKLSKPYQEACVGKPYHGVFRMDLDDNKHLKEDSTFDTGPSVLNVLDLLKLENYSQDSEYNISTENEIVSFINWSIAKHPAQKYILMVGDHGGGWMLEADGIAEAQIDSSTRGMCQDDNTYYTDIITSRELTNAIAKSNLPGGRLDYLICDCCLMAQWENIAEFARAIDGLLASVESSYGYEHIFLLESFKQNPTDIMAALKYEVDQTIDYLDMRNITQNRSNETDFGIYDLKKTDIMLGKIATLKNELIKHWDAEVDSAAINGAIVSALIPNNKRLAVPINVYLVIEQCMGSDMFDYKVWQEGDYVMVDAFTLMQVYVIGAMYGVDEMLLDYLYEFLQSEPTPVCLGSFFKHLNDGLNDETFTRLYNDFYATMKDFAYMRMTKQGDLDPYVNISPSVTFMQMQPAQSYLYRQSTFDKAVGWSEWMGKSQYFPSCLTNRFRQEL